MTRAEGRQRVRRVAVALDASPQGSGDLALATGIAVALNAELEVVFVEDTELLRLAGLPFLREVRTFTQGECRLDAERLQRELRAVARRIRSHLERSAQELGVSWSFRVWRGDPQVDLLGAAIDAELLALGRLARMAPPWRRPRSTHPLVSLAQPRLGAVYTGTDASARALALASELAAQQHARLLVILQPSRPDQGAQLRSEVLEQLGARGEDALVIRLEGTDAAQLAAAARAAGVDLLILDEANPLLSAEGRWNTLQTLACRVLIGR